jgi:hypothetical protein
MHIQARARVKSSRSGDGPTGAIEAPFTLSEILTMLASEGYSLRSASGHAIEAGGEFSFRVRGKPGNGKPSSDDDDADDVAIRRAIAYLQERGVDCRPVRVFHRDLADRPGALRDFVDHVTSKGHPVLEISIATPNPDRTIPVQIYAGEDLPPGIG